jgi:predicted phosphodiesterase
MYLMKVAFDLISDLHLETWADTSQWNGLSTSPVLIIAGDLARDPRLIRTSLKHLSECYAAVFYIDGNDEHRFKLDRLGESYKQLSRTINSINRVTFLQDNVIVIDGVALLGTNGWWSFDLDPTVDSQQSRDWMLENYLAKHPDHMVDADMIASAAKLDASYLASSVAKLQTHKDVKKIMIVTHTVPGLDLIQHDLDFHNRPIINCMGNPYLRLATAEDSEKKIHTWCFGHYHGSVDRVIDGIRFVNNCRGRGDTPHHQSVYYPKRIEIEV